MTHAGGRMSFMQLAFGSSRGQPGSRSSWCSGEGVSVCPRYFDNGSLMSRYSTTYFSTFDGRGAEP